jgi:hypothetical protein
MERRDGDPARFGKDRGDLAAGLGELAFDALDHRAVPEQGVMEGHGAADHRRKGIVAQDDRRAAGLEMHGNRRGDLVGAEHESKRLRQDGVRG